jgi:hypothetical protein
MSAAPFGPATVAPPEWSRMIGNLHVAGVARAAIRAPETPKVQRDEAIVTYTRASDAVIDDLLILRENHTLGRVTQLLGRKERG